MKAMLLKRPGAPLVLEDLPDPQPGPGEAVAKVLACGAGLTVHHARAGRLNIATPRILGHEITGEIVAAGPGVTTLRRGDGVTAYFYLTCGDCKWCHLNRETLCENFGGYVGREIDGGYAEYTMADARFCFPIPEEYEDVAAAPLLCAGLIGYRCLRKAGDARRLGLYGFGAAAHIVAQVARHEEREVFAFTSPGDKEAQDFARRLGAKWAGGSDEAPPAKLDAAIIFAPVGPLVPAALRVLERGGTVVCGGIHMSDIPSFPYEILWEERTICSVANLTRRDGAEFLTLAPKVPVRTSTQAFPLEQANEALHALRSGALTGAPSSRGA